MRLLPRVSRPARTVLLAGGTDWFVERHVAPAEEAGTLPLVLDVSRLEALRGISLDGETLRIGAAATYLEIRKDARVALSCTSSSAPIRPMPWWKRIRWRCRFRGWVVSQCWQVDTFLSELY